LTDIAGSDPTAVTAAFFAGSPAARRGAAPPDKAVRPWPTRLQGPSAPAAPSPADPGPAYSSMPPPAPLAMPRQDLRRAPRADAIAPTLPHRWLLLIAGPLAIAAAVAAVLAQVLGQDGLSLSEWAMVVLSSLLSGWVGFGFVSASAGFVAALGQRRAATAVAATEVGARTAILLPAYNEDPGLVLSAVEAIAEDLRRVGQAALYDLFILSDTRDPALARCEAVGLLRLRQRLAGAPRIYYRRRAANTDRKAGNIGDWVERHGGAYDFMLVLDADSLMSGETIVAMTGEMQGDARLGLLQSVPTIVGAETPFARLQQFGSRLYGPVFAQGLAWWSGAEGNYWGHNALIRVAAFAQSAGLPHLAGRRPWGGHIMSHDFVEAALLRRRGWAVRSVPTLGGSYEETPPTILDTAARDRRWCQGNLQHARLLGAAGLHWISRLHLALGIFAYLAPALWLTLLVCGAIVWPGEALTAVAKPQVIGVFALMLTLLVAPKAMALGLALTDANARRGFGGAARLTLGFLVECVASILITPVMMVMQSAAVVEVLIGRDSGWKPQRREGVELSQRDAWRAHRGHVALGVLGALGALLLNKYLLLWASPVFLSLALSAVLSLHTSRPGKAHATRLPRLFRIPEDARPPPVLVRSRALRAVYAAEAAARRQIEAMLREPPPVYQPRAQAPPARVRLVA
jgi:membrane glycosyltransferase